MASKRGKCIFNDELGKKYTFMQKQKDKTNSDVHCNLCDSNFNIAHGGKNDIEKHISSVKHQKSIRSVASSQPIQNMMKPINTAMAMREGVWAYHVIKSNQSFASTDCASKIFRTCFQMKDFHCARTKTEAIVTNVFAPLAQNMLKNEIANCKYITLLTDASNHGNVKMIPVVCRFFNPTVGVRVKMLEFSTAKGETSEIIASLLIDAAKKNQIDDKIVGFCADNCPTNFGSHDRGGDNNVFYRLKQWKPSIKGLGCAPHKVHNGLKHACDSLPVDIECIVVKIYSHFKTHTVRVEALKTLCDAFEDIEYSQLLGYSNTRFLALGPAIRSIAKLFEPLKQYFMSLKKCPPIIKEFFESPLAKLWLLFVQNQVKFYF